MSEPFLAEIKIVGFNFPPRGWALCDGQILPINQNQSLYSLLGTTYGGDGRTSFALPDLRGRTPIHSDSSHREGEKSGEEVHVLSIAETPTHNHVMRGTSDAASTRTPAGNVPATTSEQIYRSLGTPTNMGSGTTSNTGGSQGHDNMMPFLALNFVIALQGIFPSRN